MSVFECLTLSALFGINFELILLRNPASKWPAGFSLLASTGFSFAGFLAVLS